MLEGMWYFFTPGTKVVWTEVVVIRSGRILGILEGRANKDC